MLLRVQCSEGTKRIEVDDHTSTSCLFSKVRSVFGLSSQDFALYVDRKRSNEILCNEFTQVGSYALKHGDMIFMVPLANSFLLTDHQSSLMDVDCSNTSTASSNGINDTSAQESKSENLIKISTEDQVDQILWKYDGKIKRNFDEKLCRHGVNASCIHCSPIDAFDQNYIKENNIKHMSFHAYMRQLTAGVGKGKYNVLDELNCKLKPGCTDHLPWPKGVCSRCLPGAVTLNRQTYRHVDNVVFENASLVERFLTYWRVTGYQRVGFLIGTYEVHKDVPLGIKAVVKAIYEPPQESNRDFVRLLDSDTEQDKQVSEIVTSLGLCVVGWIFTDLIASESSQVRYMRGSHSWFVTAQECVMAGTLQSRHPNPCRMSGSGYFGSKFVTVVVTGDENQQIHMEGYQLSNQGVALVRDGCFVPTLDAPELGWVRESTQECYVPDVFYKVTDSYGNHVTRLARPLPIEYLLVDVPASTPVDPSYTFSDFRHTFTAFSVENRMLEGHVQDFSCLARYFNQFSSDQFLLAINDFHLLLYLYVMDSVCIKTEVLQICQALATNDTARVTECCSSDSWQTLTQLISASHQTQGVGSSDNPSAASTSSMEDGQWSCAHCTYINSRVSFSCEICQLPKV